MRRARGTPDSKCERACRGSRPGAKRPRRRDPGPRRRDLSVALNCFEALPDLDGTLHDVRRMLRPEGWLVIRTPNASFVCLAHAEQAGRWLRPVADANALLGMPFRRCLSVRGITTLFVRHGF